MRILKAISSTGALAALLTIMPVFSQAAVLSPDAQIDQTLSSLRDDAADAVTYSNALVSISGQAGVSWQTHTTRLADLRTAVNDMGIKLAAIEESQGSFDAAQQKEIAQADELVRLMAINTQNSIEFVNHNQLSLWRAEYGRYTQNLADEASKLAHTLGEFAQYTKVRRKDLSIRQSLGVAGE
ncbi:MAG TPA: hypothetical protein VG675_19900 [Bryobacteraceae bacterium]|nr:hypothetical protein [Bryobacteraceae bacterium]